MLKFYAHPFMATMTDLGRAIRALQDLEGGHLPAKALLIAVLGCLERDLPGLPLSPVVQDQFQRLQEAAFNPNTTIPKMRTLLYEFETNLFVDLKQHSYFLIPASRRVLFEQPDLFGVRVSARFPTARSDIAAAGRCLALNEWTAAVFHAMRSAEISLQRLAKRLGIKYSNQSEWGYLLKHMDGVLKQMENETKSQQRDRRMAYYAKVRADFAAFNSAWRKYVMHARGHYDESEAESIFRHVASLMQQLATNAPR